MATLGKTSTLFELKEHLEAGGKIVKLSEKLDRFHLEGGIIVNDEGQPLLPHIFDSDWIAIIEPQIEVTKI